MLELCLAILLTALALTSWGANLLGLPGNWLVTALAAACLWLRPESTITHVAWTALIIILLAALVGELLEFAASALGASRMGGSRRGTALAMVGSIGGAIAGLFFGTLIPIPIVGNLIASLMLGALGAFSGAIVGERWAGKDWDASIQIGNAAFWGRLLGTVAKAVCGTIACAVFVAAVWM